MATFLERALLPSQIEQTPVVPRWVFSPYFASQSELEAFCALIYPSRLDDQLPKTVAWDDSQGVFVGPFGDYCQIGGNGAHEIWLSSDEIEALTQDLDTPKQNASLESHPKSSRNSYIGHLVVSAFLNQYQHTIQCFVYSIYLGPCNLFWQPYGSM